MLNQDGTSWPHVSFCSGWTRILSTILEPPRVKNLIRWCTGTEWNGNKVSVARADSVAPEAVGVHLSDEIT